MSAFGMKPRPAKKLATSTLRGMLQRERKRLTYKGITDRRELRAIRRIELYEAELERRA